MPLHGYGIIGVDLAGLLGGRMASAEGGSVPSGVEYGEGCPLSSRLRGVGKRRELPQRGPGQSPGRKRILAYFEGHRTLILYLYDKIWGICISVPRSKFWGDLSPLVPRDLRPCTESQCAGDETLYITMATTACVVQLGECLLSSN